MAALCVGAVIATSVAASSVAASAASVSSVPRPDHIVVVLEENKASQTVLGNPNAPYINSLAANGANMTNFFAETHPSQPNYLALFSGATQGITDDSCPHTFSGANLGSEALDAGVGFVGYSEGLPSAGYTGCVTGRYARKHSPWVNFANIPAPANQPFSAFPTDYSQLPAVSFVIPNLDDDMHDGTIAQGDAWLQNNLGGYVSWAQTHNSVLAMTFDEDDSKHSNQIPTILTGQRVQTGGYAEQANHYSLLRTIEDAYGLAPVGASASAAPLLDIWTAPSGDQSPTAAFSVTCTELTCAFDASASSDPDGSVASYSWTFGDGTNASGVTASHTYTAGGSPTVTLTVTDDQGVSSSVSHPANPSTPAGGVAADAFGRTVASAWGTADQGGAWTVSGASGTFSVSGGSGRMRLGAPSAAPAARLADTSAGNVNLLVDTSADKAASGDGINAVLVARHSGSSEYRLKLRLLAGGAVHLALVREVSGAQTTLSDVLVRSLTYTPGDVLRTRFVLQTQNQTTTAAGTVWKVGSAEPDSPQLTVTDTATSVPASGSIGVQGWLAGNATNAPVTLAFDNLVATGPGSTPVQNQPPTAAFAAQCGQLACHFDATSSSDPEDGTVSGYSWDFGDGTTSTGATTEHSFPADGTYPVTLRVVDTGGATDSVSHDVTVASVSQPPIVAADTFGRSVASGWGSADLGGAWTVSGPAGAFSVANGVGRVALTSPSAIPAARLTGVSATDVNVVADVSLDKAPTGDGVNAVLVARRTSTAEYRLKLRLLAGGAVHLAWVRVTSGTQTTISDVLVRSVSYSAGAVLRVRFVLRTSGSATTASGTVWPAGGTEPAAQLTATDATAALQGVGVVGVQAVLGANATNAPVTVSYDNLSVTDLSKQ